MVSDQNKDMLMAEISHMRQTLERIEAQVIKTNGRVTALENWRIALVASIAVLAATKWPALSTLLGAGL